MLKRGVSYLRANPRLTHLCPIQTQFTNLELWVDADHAGCIRSRKSTTGTALQLGKCTIRTTCKSQLVIALSSGEAEYYGLVPGLCQALGEQSTLQDWGIRFLSSATWIRKGEAYCHSLSLGTGQSSAWKGEAAQEAHYRYACRSFR